GTGGGVGLPGGSFGVVEASAGLDGGAGDLEHRQVTRDPAAGAVLALLPGGDVVADGDDAHVEARGAQLLGGGPAVQHVARVVADSQDNAAAVVVVAGHRMDL